MLQRAASSAYSWWWASHVRTKQSKWLDNNLQDMEERVRCMLKLLGEEADSFSKRAEMYYKRRPEVISSVEEAYRAYRALAERYDHISGELHKANHTIATAFPDQVHYAMLEEEDDNFPKAITPVDSGKIRKQTVEGLMKKKRDNKLHVFKEKKGINKDNAQEEINRLQKEILVIQTEKEFIKSSYESGIAKYWDLEKSMADLQEEICLLQEAFNASAVIEDNEARALMTATALKSCEDVIFNLREQQKESLKVERIEIARIKALRERLRAIKSGYGQTVTEDKNRIDSCSDEGEIESEVYEIRKGRLELESIRERIKGLFEMDSEASVGEVAERIDQLVNKVVDLELLVSSQTAQLNRLSLENGELEKFLEDLETGRESDLGSDTEQLNRKLRKADEELSRAQSIQKAFRKDENVVRLNFSQAVSSLGNISEKLESPVLDVDCTHNKSEPDNLYERKDESGGNLLSQSSHDEDRKSGLMKGEDFTGDNKVVSEYSDTLETGHQENGTSSPASNGKIIPLKDEEVLDGGQEKEELLNEYNTVLLNYKEMKKRIAEIETKNQEHVRELTAQITSLLSVNATKDEEILALKRLLETSTFSGDNNIPEQEKSIVSAPERVIFVNEPDAMRDLNLNAEHAKEPGATNASPLEEKFRTDIDALLEENLEFWMRFSTSIQRIQEFQTKYQQLQNDEKALELNSTSTGLNKDLRDLKTELQVWLEQNAYLRSELQSRLTSIGNVKEEINQAVGPFFTSYQAAKFQGEVLNMQQENNRVADELRASLDQVRTLQTEMEAKMEQKEEIIDISESSGKSKNGHDLRSVATKNRIPLRSFLFPAKAKKPSFFSYVNPVLQKQYSGIKHHFYTRLD